MDAKNNILKDAAIKVVVLIVLAIAIGIWGFGDDLSRWLSPEAKSLRISKGEAWQRINAISSGEEMKRLDPDFKYYFISSDLEHPDQRRIWTTDHIVNSLAEMIFKIHQATGRYKNHVAVSYLTTDGRIKLILINVDGRQIKGITKELILFDPASFDQEIRMIWKPQPIEYPSPQQ